MPSLLEQLRINYDWVINDLSDKRVHDWPFMASPFALTVIILSYLYFVKVCGPRFMKERKPYGLKLFIALYNIGQIVACTTIIYQLYITAWRDKYTLGCQLIDYSDDPTEVRVAELMWWTMILKMAELTETIVFVLRKKYNQVSFLHLYHHVSTLSLGWFGTKYIAGGMATFPIIINSAIHVMMYTYYLLAAFGPEAQRIINPWKKYLTIAQMVQFCILVAHSMQAMLPSCEVPKFLAFFYIPNVFLVFYLFYDFYNTNYIAKNKKKA